MPHFFANIPKADDGTSFYRGIGPLANLKQNFFDDKLSFNYSNSPSWCDLRVADLVFMQRPFANNHVTTANNVKVAGRPLWVDFDDNMLGLTYDNPAFFVYKEPTIPSNIKTICQLADVITVSTEKLKEVYSFDEPEKVHVVPNAYDEKMFAWRDVKKEKKKTVFWRGTMIHDQGFWKYTSSMIKVAKENPEWEWFFMGGVPAHTLKQFEDAGVDPSWHPGEKDLLRYFTTIHDFNYAINMVVKEKGDFSESGSHSPWIEGTMAGMATLAPNWDEWQRDGITHYSNEEEFELGLTTLIQNAEYRESCLEKSYNQLMESFSLSKINQKRYELVQSIL